MLCGSPMAEAHSSPDDAQAQQGQAATAVETVSVADLLQKHVALEWFEAVAVMAGLCSALGDSERAHLPMPHDIVLQPDGAIAVPERRRQKPDPAALPRLLGDLLGLTQPPAPLRLFALHAIASASGRSPASFGESLAYYERPGRTELIQSAYRRCVETPMPAPVAETAPAVESDVATTPAAPARRRGPVLALIVVMASASFIAVAMAGTGRRTGVGPIDGLVDAIEHTGSVVVDSVRSELGLTSAAPEPVIETPAAAAVEKAPRPRRTHSARGEAALELKLSPTPTADTDAAADVNADSGAGEIYSSASAIEPPKLLDPVRLPSWARVPEPGDTNVFELVVSESGAVEHVRLLAPSVRMTDMMILSAAKTWMYAPAVREQRPVRYRLLYTWIPPQ